MRLLQDALVTKTIKIAKQNVICCRSQLPKRFAAIKEESEPGKEFECVVWISRDRICHKTWLVHRFSAFWLRSKCSICSYQLNIWYEDHVSSSILNSFLQGDGMSGACSGSITSWLCIAVPQRSAHFPTHNRHMVSCATHSLTRKQLGCSTLLD